MKEATDTTKRPNNLSDWYKKVLQLRKARRFARKAKRAIKSSLNGLGQEASETKEMAQLFYRMLSSKLELTNREIPPSKEEVKKAIEQLIDMGRISVFASISLLPGGGFSLVGLEILARKFGIKNFTFIPSAFRKIQAPVEKKNISPDS